MKRCPIPQCAMQMTLYPTREEGLSFFNIAFSPHFYSRSYYHLLMYIPVGLACATYNYTGKI